MLNKFPEVLSFAARLVGAAQCLVPDLLIAKRITRGDLNDAMSAAFGDTAASGAWAQRDSFIAAEIALILYLRETNLPPAPADSIAMLDDLAGLLPTQTVRSEDQIDLQQFSMPLALSWLVGAWGIARTR